VVFIKKSMNPKSLVFLVSLCFTAILAEQYVPIPSTPDGFTIGSQQPAYLKLEAWYDLACSDSLASFPIVNQALSQVGVTTTSTNPNISFTIHLFPLPYHYNAFTLAQGARIIADNCNASTCIDDLYNYFNLTFTNQNTFLTNTTYNQTQAQVQTELVTLVSTNMPNYNATMFQAGLSNSNYNMEARISWKLACSLGFAGTPTFAANGVLIDDADQWLDVSNWTSFFTEFFEYPTAPSPTLSDSTLDDDMELGQQATEDN